MDYTAVYGVIYDSQGKPYKGAIIKFSLNAAFSSNGRYYHNSEIRAVTNKYGMFEVDLAPTVLDQSGENYYNITVILDTVYSNQVVVPISTESINLSDLKDYKFPYEREDMLGGSCG